MHPKCGGRFKLGKVMENKQALGEELLQASLLLIQGP